MIKSQAEIRAVAKRLTKIGKSIIEPSKKASAPLK
jgi:hypothetical protein